MNADIRKTKERDFESILAVINDAAGAYRGVIPADRWREPYMRRDELRQEMACGVDFWAMFDGESLLGVMGMQDKNDVSLVRHAYTITTLQGQGIGARLLHHVRSLSNKPMLIGTWAAASWAIGFYEKHGFKMVSPAEKNRLLGKYWSIPQRQVETSVVLADSAWMDTYGQEDAAQPVVGDGRQLRKPRPSRRHDQHRR
ncbi:MAG: GNAT family N-acetyltransferase [Xanthomonadales bacterium]|nr:GNAT family N-acetyltransferase [Xanthomonadales bacterium]